MSPDVVRWGSFTSGCIGGCMVGEPRQISGAELAAMVESPSRGLDGLTSAQRESWLAMELWAFREAAYLLSDMAPADEIQFQTEMHVAGPASSIYRMLKDASITGSLRFFEVDGLFMRRRVAPPEAIALARERGVPLPSWLVAVPTQEATAHPTPNKVAALGSDGTSRTDGRATWHLAIDAVLPKLEDALGRRAKVREAIKHFKAHGADYRILSDGGPDELVWKTHMNEAKTVDKKTISNAISDWRKKQVPA